jgi:predicted O-methyltransferase YrrM
MQIPANARYFFKNKDNNKLPYYFNDYILNKNIGNYAIEEIVGIREMLSKSKIKIKVKDLGAGSKKEKSDLRSIGNIIKNSSISNNYGLIINKIAHEFKAKNILELGTSLGIGSMYLTANNSPDIFISVDACTESQKIAKNNLDSINIKNYKLINLSFDDLIKNNELKNINFDLIYIDGNHKGEATINYYNYLNNNNINKKNIFIFDDINWSKDMYKAWEQICLLNKENCILDFFRLGIIFSNHENLPKGYFRIK